MQPATEAAKPQSGDAAVRYVIDAQRSTFVAQAFSAGLLSAFGHDPKFAVRDLQGEAHLASPGNSLDNARLSLRIKTASLEVMDDINEKDKQEIYRQMYNEVLEGDRFPEILYECSQVTANGSGNRYWAVLHGQFTLHGTTRVLPVSARIVVTGDSLRASGEFSVKQSDYGIGPVKVAGGALKLKDDVKCTFDIMAEKQG